MKKFKNLREVLEIGTKEIVDAYKKATPGEVDESLEEKLKVSDGIGAWIKDFQDSDAPQFKGKSNKERKEMAIAAYLSAKRGDK